MIRNKKALRSIAIFLLLNILQFTFQPSIALALTSGPSQPEFTSYEEVDNTDMVNLMTGDFTYNIPLLEIPGPEGGFALPLSYHAGIRPEQQSSWVGLGWSLNPGAINRNVNQFPDDFSGQTLTTSLYNAGGHGHSINFLVGTYTYDSEKGEGGTIGIKGLFVHGYGNQWEETSVLGITMKDKSAGETAVEMVGAALTVASLGSVGVAKFAAQTAVGLAIETGIQAAYDIGSNNYKSFTESKWAIESSSCFFYKQWKYWLNTSKTETMIGSLHFGDNSSHSVVPGGGGKLVDWNGSFGSNVCSNPQNTPQFITGVVSDIQININSAVRDIFSPLNISYDQYHILGTGISGTIKPYRYDVGSTALNFWQTSYWKYNLVPFTAEKARFRYDGDFSNYYNYHRGIPTTNNAGMGFDFGVFSCSADATLQIAKTDAILYDNSKRVEEDRRGFVNKKLIQGRNIEWYTNSDILSGVAINNGFIDFLNSTDRNTFRDNLPASVKSKGIGGFSVSRPDGMTFHYSLPAFNKSQFTQTRNTQGPSNHERSDNPNWYAYEWLLTAITGPDFVDRGEIGILDEQDWGYWTKLEYGKFASDYIWRSPYWGETTSSENSDYVYYSDGKKETYYLNAIKTRSHTGVFVKEVKQDGKGWYDINNTSSLPSSSLKLNEVIVLTNQDYATLVKSTGLGGYGLALNSNGSTANSVLSNGDTYDKVYDINDFSSSMNTFITANQVKRIQFGYDDGAGDLYKLCKNTVNSFSSATTPIRSGDPYSGKNGKLTLQNVSVFGKNNEKLLPDFKFNYGYNPDYHVDKWDGWGMYKGDGSGHYASLVDNHGAAWSLNKITTPLGGTIEIDYERDKYNSISGKTPWKPYPLTLNLTNNSFTAPVGIDLNTFYKVDGSIRMTAVIKHFFRNVNVPPPYDCTLGDPQIVYHNHDRTFTIQSISGNVMTVQENITNELLMQSGLDCIPPVLESYQTYSSTVFGGDLRVSQIRTSDLVNTYRTNYIYTIDGTPTGPTSGVIAQEPDYIKTTHFGFYDYYDYPVTPVIYNKVSVYQGRLNTWNDYKEKSVYTFSVPDHASTVTVTSTQPNHHTWTINSSNNVNGSFRLEKHLVDVKSNQIGRLESYEQFDKTNTLLSSTKISYNKNWQGNFGEFTQGAILCDKEYVYNSGNQDNYFRLSRTTKTYHPNIVSEVTTTNGKMSYTVKNRAYDLYTGAVLDKEYTNSLGITLRSITVPAYERYPEMGSKALNPKNKNMMSQVAAEYVYKDTKGWGYQPGTVTNLGTSGNWTTYNMDMGTYMLPPYIRVGHQFGLSMNETYNTVTSPVFIFPYVTEISANRKSLKFKWASDRVLTGAATIPHVPLDPISVGIQTWDNQWNKRSYNPTTFVHSDAVITDDVLTVGFDEQIWRKKANYVWKSPLLNTDGTYQNFVDYNWDPLETQQANWQKTGEVVNYDIFSKPLETKDINGNYSVMKMGYDLNYPLTSVKNANYYEVAYSGAEDITTNSNIGNTSFFGGEVYRNGGTEDNTVAHTGKNSLKIIQTFGFNHMALVGAQGLAYNKKYRASVWIYDNGTTPADAQLYYHMTNSTTGQILATYNQGSLTFANATPIIKAGKWRLLNLDFTLTGSYPGHHLVVGCYNPSATPAYFDDFRFHPLNTSMSCNVYDPQSGLVTHVLDGDGFYVRYEYDAKNRIKAIYKETIKGEIKTKEYNYNMPPN